MRIYNVEVIFALGDTKICARSLFNERKFCSVKAFKDCLF